MRYIFTLLVLLLWMDTSSGALIVSESFDYAPGSRPGNGGSGWKESWGSDPMSTTNTGLTYTDSLGNELQVAGNASTRKSNGSSQIEAVRDFQNEIENTFWFSVLIHGVAGNNTVSLGINESFYVGQGAKDVKSTSWGVYDADKTQLSAVGAAAENEIALFVGRALYSQSKDKFTHLNLWLNPNLDAQPDASATSNFYSGSIKEFDKIPKIAVYHTSDLAALDELRFGESYADVTAFTAAGPSGSVPEPATFLILALMVPFAILLHRKQRLALVGLPTEGR